MIICYCFIQVSCSEGQRGIYLREPHQLSKPVTKSVSVTTHYDDDVGEFLAKFCFLFVCFVTRQLRALDSRKGRTTSTRFDLKFFHVFSKSRYPGNLPCTFDPPEKLALLSLLKKVKPSPDSKMIKLLTFDNSFPPLRHSR